MSSVSRILGFLLAGIASFSALADESNTNTQTQNSDISTNTDLSTHTYNPFDFSLYEPTYILPFYYTAYPDYAVYQGNTPDNQTIDKEEVNYQLSFKVPLWRDMFSWPDSLDVFYTQDSFWQLYNSSAFFRETNYEPGIFLNNEVDKYLGDGWQLESIDIGAMHQSNGRGGELERSWNRAYFDTNFTKGNWLISIQPWYPIFKSESIAEHNPNITKYLGYGQELAAYNYDNNTFSFACRNVVESGFARGAEWLTWSFPLIHRNIKGYVYVFSGYGQSLIEYNHYTNSVGIGITINDWSTKTFSG